jgi:hypothetical protein
MVQTDPDNKHYGCLAFVEMGLIIPRYVHGDYDLYAIIPKGQAFNPNKLQVRESRMGSTMAPDSMRLQDRLRLSVSNKEGELSFRIATFVNNLIRMSTSDIMGALMVNHGEQIIISQTFETVLAIRPAPVNGQLMQVLNGQAEHEYYYRTA